MKLTKKQKAAIETIRASGERVVIESDWLVYLANSRTLPFGPMPCDSYMAVDIVRSELFDPIHAHVARAYVENRQAAKLAHCARAIEYIKAGHIDDARDELRLADQEAFLDGAKVELYRLK